MLLSSHRILPATLLPILMGLSQFCFSLQQQDEPAASEVTSPTPQALTPRQLPSGPVIITHQNGELTIQALNSELKDVLRAVSRETGALIDLPDVGNERVFGEFGPGPVATVLASLLNGSRFNYVMVARPDNPRTLARVVLTLKVTDASSGSNSTQGHNNDASRVTTALSSDHSDPIQPVPARPQDGPTISVASVSAQGEDKDFLDRLATELGPEAASLDPQQRRALEAMISQMNGQGSDVGSSAAQNLRGTPPPFRNRSGRR